MVRWRLQVAAVVVPVAVTLLGASYLLPGRTTPQDAPAVSGASQTRCLPTGPIDSVAALNRFVSTVRGTPGFAGGDVGASVQLQDGRDLYVFGDTLRGEGGSARFVRNSMLVFGPDCAQAVLPAGGGAIIPDRSDGVGYWPMSVARIQRPGYDLVGVASQRVRRTGSGAFDFVNVGPATALFLVRRGEVPQLLGVHDLGPDSADTTRPMWGAAAVVDRGWVYLYGTARAEDAAAGTGFSLRVARVRPDDLLEQSRWRYWDGDAWRRDAGRAAVVLPEGDSVSQTLSVFRRGATWYAVSKRGEFLGSDLTVWTAPAPTGPFGTATVVARIPSEATSGTLRYMPLAHPDLLPEPGTVVVSYSENNTDPDVVVDDPRRYRPRFLRVPLPAAP